MQLRCLIFNVAIDQLCRVEVEPVEYRGGEAFKTFACFFKDTENAAIKSYQFSHKVQRQFNIRLFLVERNSA